ncbi:hypothetical protein A4U49_06015 [Acidithiobacillus ferrivorans]|uniref:hypothetical protein n=1 Tax=Acidithiobacillus ferrivorans TaxID=160808 RepID=UPI0008940F07|nr:hypothetical protein [Acidithiobacillus ferrivorans]OFA16733.1 hypothetical protein A4U49_06015 [Acidithiobacillus ferrivorans]
MSSIMILGDSGCGKMIVAERAILSFQKTQSIVENQVGIFDIENTPWMIHDRNLCTDLKKIFMLDDFSGTFICPELVDADEWALTILIRLADAAQEQRPIPSILVFHSALNFLPIGTPEQWIQIAQHVKHLIFINHGAWIPPDWQDHMIPSMDKVLLFHGDYHNVEAITPLRERSGVTCEACMDLSVEDYRILRNEEPI